MPPALPTRPSFVVAGIERLDLAAALLTLSIDDRLAGPCRCRAAFTNWDPAAPDTGHAFDDTFTAANRSIDASSAGVTLFRGEIVGIEAIFARDESPAIAVIAAAVPREFRETGKTRRFSAIDDRELFSLVAREHGLRADLRVSGAGTTAVEQRDETDFALVVRRATEIGADAWLEEQTLHVADRLSEPPALVLVYGAALLEFTGTLSPSASGWSNTSPRHCAAVAADTPNLRAGISVSIQGVGQAFSGVYRVTQVEHRFDAGQGFRSAFEAERVSPAPPDEG